MEAVSTPKVGDGGGRTSPEACVEREDCAEPESFFVELEGLFGILNA